MRPKFITRIIRLVGEAQRDTVIAALRNAPIDPARPLEVVIREEQKARKPDQNSAMWAGPLKDIEEQAWVEGRRYSAPTWHEYFKRKYLPEDDDPRLEELAKDGYRKWDIAPDGERELIGSTTQLTVRGFAEYLTQVEAEGASMGVQFHAPPMRSAA